MKEFIIGIGIILLYLIFIPYEQDNSLYARKLEELKYVADECSASASLYLEEDIKKGDIIYNRIEGKIAIESIIQQRLKLDDGMKSKKGSYWKNVKYDVYYFDDSNTIFPYMFTDTRTGYKKLITEPTIIVTIDGGKPKFRLNFASIPDGIRSSAYEYDNYSP